MDSLDGREREFRVEIESTLVHSLPRRIVQETDLLERFVGTLDSDEPSPRLTLDTVRLTRIGCLTWRVGTRRVVARSVDSTRPPSRLALLRRLRGDVRDGIRYDDDDGGDDDRANDSANRDGVGDDDDGGDDVDRANDGANRDGVGARRRSRPSTVVSEFKVRLLSERTPRYERSWPLSINVRYPLLIEDSLSVEIPTTRDVERSLLLAEDDVSDCNLGIRVTNRLSRVERDERGCRVRVSLRATLNEYHEIAYQLELECEERSVDDRLASSDGVERRERRHEAIVDVYRRIVLPIVSRVWPDGLRYESVRPPPDARAFDAASPFTLLTGRSERVDSILPPRNDRDDDDEGRDDRGDGDDDGNREGTRENDDDRERETRLERALRDGRVELAEFDCPCPIAKLKYDGERSYATLIHGALRSESRLVTGLDPDDLCGLCVYQLEVARGARRDDRACALTEVTHVVDHRVSVARGGSLLSRHADQARRVETYEQTDPVSAYELDDATLWPWISTEGASRVLDALSSVADVASRLDSTRSVVGDPRRRLAALRARCRDGRAFAHRGLEELLSVAEPGSARDAWSELVGASRETDADFARLYVPVDLEFSCSMLNAMRARRDSRAERGIDESASALATSTNGRAQTLRAVCVSAAVVVHRARCERATARFRSPRRSDETRERGIRNRDDETRGRDIRNRDDETMGREILNRDGETRGREIRNRDDDRRSGVVDGRIGRGSTERLPTDGWLSIARRRRGAPSDAPSGAARCSRAYVKLKTRQTVEMAVSRNGHVMYGRDGALYEYRRDSVGPRTRELEQEWLATSSNERGGVLTVLGLSSAAIARRARFARDDRATGRRASIAEFARVAPRSVRFVRWRDDKDWPDSSDKIASILENEGPRLRSRLLAESSRSRRRSRRD